jgi:Tfp pilus assembly protein PilX
MSQLISKCCALRKLAAEEKGIVLIAALTLLSALTLLGTTAFLLSSTDIRIGSNFRNNQLVLQVAMAGTERARELLRVENLASSNLASFSDELNSSTRKGANGVLNGYGATTDDVALASGTINSVSYAAYLTNDSAEGTTNTTDSNGKVLITSVATGPSNSKAQVQIEVSAYTPPSTPAVIYSKGDVKGNGSALTINGNDACGAQSGVGPIYTMTPATTSLSGSPTLSGSPSTPQQGTLDVDIAELASTLKKGATVTLTEDQNGDDIGSSTSYVTVYSDTSNPTNVNGLKMQNLTGYGTLVVKGDLELGGGFTWYGMIVVTGELKLNGGGAGINIIGKVLSGTSTSTDVDINGGNVINYNSCEVSKAMATNPMRVVNWKQSY